MCNDYGTSVTIEQLEQALRDVGTRLSAKHSNMQPREDIRPSDKGPALRTHRGGVELAELTWGFPPPKEKARPIINFRSENRNFTQGDHHGRCLLPASHFFEFTGTKYPKTKWRFRPAHAEWFCIAGIWRHDAQKGDAYTLLTTAPGPDIEPYHDRQIVILKPGDYDEWLHSDKPVGHLLKPLPKGSLHVAEVQR